MKNNLIVLVILAVIAVLVVAFAFGGRGEAPQEEVPHEEVVMEEEVEEVEEDTLPEGALIHEINIETSTLGWSASRLVGGLHEGEVAISEGSLVEVDGEFTGGEFVIDMTAITEEGGSERFLQHVASDDFFGVEEFPTAMLEITSFELDEDSETSFVVTGDLTIRDKTNEVNFPATIERGEEGITAQAEFDIDRTRWGVVFDSGSVFTTLGERAIKDEISYTLELTFN